MVGVDAPCGRGVGCHGAAVAFSDFFFPPLWAVKTSLSSAESTSEPGLREAGCDEGTNGDASEAVRACGPGGPAQARVLSRCSGLGCRCGMAGTTSPSERR